MPVEANIVAGSVLLRLTGCYELADIAEELDQAFTSPGFVRGSKLLVDARDSRVRIPEPDAMRRAAIQHGPYLLRAVSAVGFLTSDATQRGVAREFQRGSASCAFEHSFADFVSAARWLAEPG